MWLYCRLYIPCRCGCIPCTCRCGCIPCTCTCRCDVDVVVFLVLVDVDVVVFLVLVDVVVLVVFLVLVDVVVFLVLVDVVVFLVLVDVVVFLVLVDVVVFLVHLYNMKYMPIILLTKITAAQNLVTPMFSGSYFCGDYYSQLKHPFLNNFISLPFCVSFFISPVLFEHETSRLLSVATYTSLLMFRDLSSASVGNV